jgi:23S rRNA pseudouridine2604 synthase
MNMNNLRGVQINKYVSMQGICSRREADEWIKLGRVRINGKVAKLQNRVQDGDRVTVDDEYVSGQKKEKLSTYMLFYKQAGLTTTTDENDRTSVTRFIDYHKRIFPVGRLDKDSEGLLILTDDGDIVNKILRAGNRHDKEYVVEVDKLLAADFCTLMSAGIPILGTTTLPCVVKQEGSRKFRIILQQGLNRQIRRMCEYLGYKVKRLTRVRIMHLRVDGIRPGTWRLMTPVEMQGLQKVLGESKNEDDVAGVRERGGFADGAKGDRERDGRGVPGRDGAKAYRAGSDAKPKSARHTPFDIPDIDDDELAFDVDDSRKRTPTTNQTRNTYWSDRKRGKRASYGEDQGSGKAYGSGNVVGKAGRGSSAKFGGATRSGASAKSGASTKSSTSSKSGPDKGGKGSKGGRGAAAYGGSVTKPGGKAPQGKDNKQATGGGKKTLGSASGGSATKPAGKTGGKMNGASSSQAASGGKRISVSKGATTGGKPNSGGKGFSGGSKGIKKQGKTR